MSEMWPSCQWRLFVRTQALHPFHDVLPASRHRVFVITPLTSGSSLPAAAGLANIVLLDMKEENKLGCKKCPRQEGYNRHTADDEGATGGKMKEKWASRRKIGRIGINSCLSFTSCLLQ